MLPRPLPTLTLALAVGALAAACAGAPDVSTTRPPPAPVSPSVAAGASAAPEPAPLDPLLDALSRARDAPKRRALIDQIGLELGARGLASALNFVTAEPKQRAWSEHKAIFDQLHTLADPRTADALLRWVEAAPRHPHWRGEVGVCLAEIGDLRGASYLGKRMLQEPADLYQLESFWQSDEGGHLSRTDLPRVVAARLLADLALLHPEARSQLLTAAEGSVLAWANDHPQPHANALRFLAAAGSSRMLPALRGWAFPDDPLPLPGAQPPFPSSYETAQNALRYIGAARDEPSFSLLLDQLKRKTDSKLDITQQGLGSQQGPGIVMMGMALRALGYGAAQGLGEWGDARAVKPLMAFIEDETWNEEARQAACEAVAWCADDKVLAEIVQKTRVFARRKEPEKQWIAACYASTLAPRSPPAVVPALLDLLKPGLAPGVPEALARALGAASLDTASADRLFDLLKDPSLRRPAAIALFLGGSQAAAERAAAVVGALAAPEADAIADDYFRAFGVIFATDLDQGNLLRWVANAEAIGAVSVAGVAQVWAQTRLRSQLQNLRFDNGPHSLTRVVARHRLSKLAAAGERRAIAALAMLEASGALAALADEPGEIGQLARARLLP